MPEVGLGGLGAKDACARANEAARIESLCKSTGRRLVIAKSVEQLASTTLESLGHHELRGVSQPIEVFTLPLDVTAQ